MLGFLGGMASGAGKELDDQESRAFALKLKNAQIEGELNNAKQLADYTAASPEATQDMAKTNDVVLPQGMRANKADQAWWTSSAKNDKMLASAQARALSGRGANQGMTRAKFNEIYQVDTPGKPDDWMNNTEVIATRDRLKREEPTQKQTDLFDTSVKSLNLINTLWDMREGALGADGKRSGGARGENGLGMIQGLVSRADGFVTGGKNRPNTVAFINLRKSLSTKFAKMFEDTGNIAWQEAERAVAALGDERLDPVAAEVQKDHLVAILENIKETTLKSSPGLRRKIQREQEGTNMKSLSDAHRAGIEKGKQEAAANDTTFDNMSEAELLNIALSGQQIHEDTLAEKKAAEEKANKTRKP